MSDLLAAVVAAARTSAAHRERTQRADVERRARACLAEARIAREGGRFVDALAAGGIRVIAECKRRSPSRGVLRQDYDAAAIARAYEQAGAAAISVLTEPTFFDGSLDDLQRVRGAVRLPLLCKDFIVTEFQVIEARACGADAVLLIVAALTDDELATLLALASSLQLDALVEVHDAAELDRALAAGARIVGVNSRDLRTLEVTPAVHEELIARIPAEAIAVAESGLRSAADLGRLRGLGYRAFLVGERLVTEPDPGAALARLLAPKGAAV